MDRQFARNIAIALCTVLAAGCDTAGAENVTAPVTAAAIDHSIVSDGLPTTLEGEIARAHQLRVSGDYKGAAQALGQLLLIAPDNPRVVGEYGKALVQQDRPQDALPFMKRAVELQTNDWTLYSALGVAYDQIDQHAEAKLAYEHALSLRPGAPEVLNNYAVSRMLAGDLDGAQRLFAQAQAAGGSNDKIASNLAILAGMKRPGGTVAAPATERAVNRPATAAPRVMAATTPRVMMQKVPFDPQAGPVAHPRATKLAATAMRKPKLAAAQAAPKHAAAAARPPMLRTAADNQ